MDSLATGTRRDILDLLSKQELTTLELAERLQITPAGVRQHLAPLEALRWIERDKEVQGAHRPSFRYRLTSEGRSVFPKRYDLLLGAILEELHQRQGAEQVQWIVRNAARRIAERKRESDGGGKRPQPWEPALGWLEAEFSWKATATVSADGSCKLAVHHCPFQVVSASHPELCGTFFVTLIGELCGASGKPLHGEHTLAERGPACCSLLFDAATGK